MHTEAIKDLIYKMADDRLILGHRNSEWTGMGPLLEEDIAFSSMAQDKIGQSYYLFQMLEELGEGNPDTVAFMRPAIDFHNAQLTELPNGDYDFSLIRHFLFDHSDYHRFQMLSTSSCEPLARLASKMIGEIKYHVMHADIFIKQLGNATEESISRLQQSLDVAWPYALGIFEPSKFEDSLKSEGIFEGETVLKKKWIESIEKVIEQTQLVQPNGEVQPIFGGRYGQHTEYLQPLLDEMSEVFRIEPSADW